MGWFTGTIILLVFATLISYPLLKKIRRNGFFVGAAVLGFFFFSYLPFMVTIQASGPVEEYIEWLPHLGLAWSLRVDALSLSMALLVTGAGSLIMMYCAWYFKKNDLSIPRFHAIFLGFSASMLGLVIADNLFLLFIFWECTTVFSFLLIGHNHSSRIARAAALQALIVTTLGGLTMLVGFVLLAYISGTASMSELLADPPAASGIVTVSIFLVVVGALSKSAIIPFHFWLPGAMAAPTPVSAYLHAASMVKAGVYLIARFVPAFWFVPGLSTTLVLLGGLTMIWGAIRALRQFDLKLIIAHGTVSQLGMLVMLFGLGVPRIEYAAIVLLFAHAVAKAPLFLTVGVIDRNTGERDIRKLSGIGRQQPALAAVGIFAAASMAGIPPFVGFVAKEAALTSLSDPARGSALVWFTLIVFIVGSALTVAYMFRFIWGAFGPADHIPDTKIVRPVSSWILLPPAIFALLALSIGVLSTRVESWFALTTSAGASGTLGLWHGFTPALLISVLVIGSGIALFVVMRRNETSIPVLPEKYSASHIYWRLTYLLDFISVKVTAQTQRGSLPFYLATIFSVTIAGLAVVLVIPGTWPSEITFMTSWAQIPIAIIMIAAAIRASQSMTRFKSIVLVGVTGYGMVAIFALHGAPDLALTQALVETITLIAFILVIRRLPIKIGVESTRKIKVIRMIIAGSVSIGLGMVALISLGARDSIPVSSFFGELALHGGHGANIVNVTLVDIRGWDTMGELSVVLAAATGVASLVFLSSRGNNLPKLSRKEARTSVRKHLRKVADPNDPTFQTEWTLAGFRLRPEKRSIVLEVVVRLIFHALILVSVYLLLAGHNNPGGGFAAGLVAGLALVARYLAGGRHELGATVTLDAGRILGLGLILATGTALVPMFFGQSALASTWFELSLGPFGDLSFVTSTIFDIGVYFVVLGLMLDVLRSLGAEIDEQEERDMHQIEEEGIVP